MKVAFKPGHYVLLLIALILIALTGLGDNHSGIITDLTTKDYIFLFFVGWLASSCLILPGISGALVFVLFGYYETVTHALSELNFTVILVVGAGIAIGALLTSKLIRFLFQHYTVATYAVMIGLVSGSTFVIFPGIPVTVLNLAISLLTFLIGLFLAIRLGRIKYA